MIVAAASRIATVGAAFALVMGAAALAGGPLGPIGAQSSCASPYAPAGWELTSSGFPYDGSSDFHRPDGATTTLPPVLFLSYGIGAAPTVEVEVPAGTVTLSHPGDELVAASIGDLDDDGITDHWVGAMSADGYPPTAAWVLPGSTTAGAHDIADVGIATWPGLPWALTGNVTDWNGDGVDDLLLVGADPVTTDRSAVFDGPTVMAAGAGGDATGDVPLLDAPGLPYAHGVVPGLGEVFVSGSSNLTDPATGGNVWLTDGSGTTAFSTLPAPAIRLPAAVQVIDSGADGLFLVVSHSDRGGSQEVVWRIDDPCGGLPPSAASPPAAEAVSVAPAITG